jgi:tetratricopeptide (TPR) repeat protein
MGNLALVLNAKGDQAAAEQLLRDDVAIVRKTLGVRHPAYAQALSNLATVSFDQGRLDESRTLLEQAVRIVRPILSDDHPRLATYEVNLARVQIAGGDAVKAERALRHALHVRQRLYPPGDWRVGQVQSLLGASLAAQANYAGAEPLLLAAAQVLQPIPGPQGREADANRRQLASLYAAWHRPSAH